MLTSFISFSRTDWTLPLLIATGNGKSFDRPQVESFGRPQVESSFTLPFTGVLEDNGLLVWTAFMEERWSLMVMFGVRGCKGVNGVYCCCLCMGDVV